MTTVYVRNMSAAHQDESFCHYLPLPAALCREMQSAVKEIFDLAGGASLLKSSGAVYIKPNGIDAKPYCYTRPEFVEAVIRYWYDAGATQVYLFENSTQSNFTRMVFRGNGFLDVCKRTGAKPIYLDEEKNVSYEFKGKRSETEQAEGYAGTSFEIPQLLVDKLVEHRDENLYISLPKLKTHSMAGVTLGVKNQWAFPRQNDRRADHNYNLPHKLVDVLGYIRPDFTLIEGMEGTIHGHYPVTAFADACIVPFRLLIGSRNVVAADIVGARIFGLTLDEVAHLKLAVEKGYADGVSSLEDITIDGDISAYQTIYPTDLIPQFPADIRLIAGVQRHCREGCRNNPLSVLQVMAYDHGGKGGFTMVMGKGHDLAEIDRIEGRVLLVGRCAIEEVGERLMRRLGKRNVYQSGFCNDLRATNAALFHLMHVNPQAFLPVPFHVSAACYFTALAHGTKANIPFPFAHWVKTV